MVFQNNCHDLATNLSEKQTTVDIFKKRCNMVFLVSVCDCFLVISSSAKSKKKDLRPSPADITPFTLIKEMGSKHPSLSRP